jgi:tetratricopeptide (TPR) repeat protein
MIKTIKEITMEKAKALDKITDEALGAELEEAYNLMIKKQFTEAEAHMKKAWGLIPEPKYQWDSSQSTIYNLSEFYLEWKRYDNAKFWAKEVFKCNPLPGDGTPHFFLGKIHFEAGEFDDARRQFEKAYEIEGRRAFQDEDPKYFKFLKQKEKT